MSETITASLTVSGGDTITAEINTLARGPVGPAGEGGSGAITSATTSDGTANLSISNVTTATAEVTGTLTANHIHGNLAGNVYAHIRAGENLAKGDPVYVSGSHGSGSTLIAIVSKADASNAAKMPAVGIMDANLAHNATGHMVITGTITELATNAYSINAELYVAAGGGMTATPPTARAQPVARVERSNANNGAILVKVNGLSASDATPSTLVRRTSEGAISVNGMIATGGIEFNGNDAEDSMTFNQVYYYYGAGAASAHRFALNGGAATGDELFTALTPAAARTTLELDAFSTNGSITGTGALTLASAAASNINLTPGTTGFIDIAKASASGARESILRAKVSDAGNDALFISNSTSVNNRFNPTFGGFANSSASAVPIGFQGATDAVSDTGAVPMVIFNAFRTSNTTDPFNGTLSSITTRPLFRFANNGTQLAEITAAGQLQLLATTASTSTTTGALVVAGGVGIAGAVNAGSLALTAPLPITSGGTGATTAGLARTALGSGSTGDALFTAATPAAARTTLGARTFTKPTDESRSSAGTGSTYTVDTHLKDIPLEAGKSYKIEFYIPAYVPSTEGGKVRLLLPLSSRATVPNMNGGVSVTLWGNGAGGSVSTTASGAPTGMRYFTLQAAAGHAQNRAIAGVAYTDVLASAGNLSLEWAQNAPGVNATILLAGATLTVTEL